MCIEVNKLDIPNIQDMSNLSEEERQYAIRILKELSEKCPTCVFKGGTSLSKCHHVIDRFSEDIDISFSDKFLSLPSKVTNFSLQVAFLTIKVSPKRLAS